MTLRLTDEQDQLLNELAASLGTSKKEAVVRAIAEASGRRRPEGERDALSTTGRECYADLLDRLGS